MQIVTELFAHQPNQAESRQLNWGAVLGTLLVWLAVLLLGIQSWQDRRASEEKAFAHLQDITYQLERHVNHIYATDRLLAGALADLLRRNALCANNCYNDLMDIQKRFAETLPGSELMMLDATGSLIAETEHDMRQRIRLLDELIAQVKTDNQTMVSIRFGYNTRHELSFIVAKAFRNREGKLSNIAVLVQPLSVLNASFHIPQLGPNGSITVLDADHHLLLRKPEILTAQVGQTMLSTHEMTPAILPGSFYEISPLDGKKRLKVVKEVPFSVASGGLILLLGMSTDDYLADWYRSTMINLLLALMLLIGWGWGLYLMRRVGQYHHQLQASIMMTQKVLGEIPLPIMMVDQKTHHIVRSNIAMIETFGSLASENQPVTRLFREDRAWLELPTDNTVVVREMITRQGQMYTELHRSLLGNLSQDDGPYWLVTLVDVSESHSRTERLLHEAHTDTLTGLANRRYFAEIAEQDIQFCRNVGSVLSILALDIDHFKQVNDTYGHDAGDLVLQAVAHLFKACMRDGDLAARMGGEEFNALLPGANIEQAVAIAERVRQSVSAMPVMLADGRVINVTISIGVSLWYSSDTDIQEALKRADQALYMAKEQGRNRVITHHSSET